MSSARTDPQFAGGPVSGTPAPASRRANASPCAIFAAAARRTPRRFLCMAVGLLLLLSTPMVARGEARRVEAVGTYGLRDSMRTKVIARDAAIDDALWEAVSRVGLELVGEASRAPEGAGDAGDADSTTGPATGAGNGASARTNDEGPPREIDSASLRTALGKDILPYTRSFRILEDQGEVPVLFEEEPGVQTEYVVVVEVIVDVDRVTQALEQSGWIATGNMGPSAEIRLELLGLERYEALESVLRLLREDLGASRVQPLEFSPGRQVLAIEGAFGTRELAEWLDRLNDPSLRIKPLAIDESGGRLRAQARWTEAVEEPDPAGEGGQQPIPGVSSRRARPGIGPTRGDRALRN